MVKVWFVLICLATVVGCGIMSVTTVSNNNRIAKINECVNSNKLVHAMPNDYKLRTSLEMSCSKKVK